MAIWRYLWRYRDKKTIVFGIICYTDYESAAVICYTDYESAAEAKLSSNFTTIQNGRQMHPSPRTNLVTESETVSWLP